MTDKKDPLGQDALLVEASRWFAALDAGTVPVEAFEAWRQSNPAHAVAYARIVAQWEAVASMPVEAEQAPILVGRRQWMKLAAVGFPMAILGGGFVAQRAYAWDSASTAVGETRRVPLPDGSVAYLNTDSALSWRFGAKERILRLERGEIALDLRHGNATILRAKAASIPLTAGLFDARIKGELAELTMVDGAAVHLSGQEKGATLQPNMSVMVGAEQPSELQRRSSEQVASLMAWRAGEIVFLDQSVAEAVADFNRHLVRKITVGDAVLAREKIGGRFDLDRPDQFLDAVSLSLNAHVVTTASGYELTR